MRENGLMNENFVLDLDFIKAFYKIINDKGHIPTDVHLMFKTVLIVM